MVGKMIYEVRDVPSKPLPPLKSIAIDLQSTHVTPEDLEREELEAYAEEYVALEDFEDVDEINWSLSDFEDNGHAVDHDTDMS